MALPLEVSRERVRLRAALVDPYAGSREGLRVSLIVEGCEVVTAADVRQATALVRSGGFDLGVIDLDLTTAGGTMRNALELARFFRDSNPTAPLVLLVAEAGRDLEAEAGALHPALLLEKPINPARLRAVVRQLRKATAAS
jgi:CheY-like chemotaxis protein